MWVNDNLGLAPIVVKILLLKNLFFLGVKERPTEAPFTP